MNLKKMMKQAQEMQKRVQEEMTELNREGTSGGGMVTVAMRGTKEVTELRISPDVVDPEDVEMLQDLVIAAINDASRKIDEALQERMGGMGASLGLPGL